MSVKAAIIGLGWGVSVQLPLMRKVGFSVEALCGRNLEKTSRIAAEHNIPKAYIDIDELLQQKDIELVYIGSPPKTHRDFTLKALEAGKHVICEKPMALSVEETQLMLEASKKYPQQLCVINHELRFLDTMKMAREYLQNHKLGDIFAFEAKILRQVFTDKPPRYSWKSNKSDGGGVLMNISSHLIDAVSWLLDEQLILQASQMQRPIEFAIDEEGQQHKITSDQWSSLALKTGSDIYGTISSSFLHLGDDVHKIIFEGTRGKLMIDQNKLYLIDLSGEKSLLCEEPGSDPFSSTYTYLETIYNAVVQKDLDLVAQGAHFSQGHQTQLILDEARKNFIL